MADIASAASSPASASPGPPASGGPRNWLLALAGRFRRLYSVVLVLVGWELLAIVIHDPLILPRLSTVLETVWQLSVGGELIADIRASLTRALGGFLVAMALGVPLGILMGWFRQWDDFWSLLISFANPIPKIGLVPLFVLWLGIGETSKISVIAAGAFFPILINTYNGVRGVNPIWIWRAKTLGPSQWEILSKVILPAVLPSIFVGARLAMALAWVILIAAEMVAARSGLGFRILFGQQMFETSVVFAGLLTISLFGFVFDRMLQSLSHRACGWYFRLDQDHSGDRHVHTS